MTKCGLCKKTIDETFLGKIIGTYFMEGKKKRAVCLECQRDKSFSSKEKSLYAQKN